MSNDKVAATFHPDIPPAGAERPAAEPEVVLEVGRAFEKRREIAQRLSDQDRYIGAAVRTARKAGHTWAQMARAANVSDVAILKAARRPESQK